jgi:alpha-mannosidase
MTVGRLLWQIGAEDGVAPELVDNYREPGSVGVVVWRVEAGSPGWQDAGAPRQVWPSFHASEADPAAGYQRATYAVLFKLAGEPAAGYLLRLHYLVITPRYGHVAVAVNGVSGRLYLRPAPADVPANGFHACLHTSLSAEGVAELVIPGALLRRGENCIELAAADEEPVARFNNPDKVARLDRMATGAGFSYRMLALHEADAGRMERGLPGRRLAGKVPALRAVVAPTVVYRADESGGLWETCYLHVELSGAVAAGEWQLELREGERREEVAVEMPAAALGHVRQEFELFDGEGVVSWRLRAPDGEVAAEGEVVRRRKWTVYVTPHAHTDIGYTHRQAEVAERLARNIDTALDFIAADSDAPAFAYHLDSSWALHHYLETRGPERRQQLWAAVCAGKVGIPANLVILLSQFAGLEELIRNQQWSTELLAGQGLAPRFAAVVDVPSLSGSLPALLAGCGVPYLAHAGNQDRGPLRALGKLPRYAPFYWEGANGGRVLVWLAKMYCELRKVCGSPPSLVSGAQGLDVWLMDYERDDYAPDAVLMYGQEADNTDLDPQPDDFVRQWNQTYAYPRLVPSVVEDYFADVEARFGEQLPTFRGDGGAYWEDGACSSMGPTIAVRRAQAQLPAAARLAGLAAIHQDGTAFPRSQFDAAWQQLLLYDEHTWGAFLSVADPEALLQRDQWAVKEQMAAAAADSAAQLLHGAVTRHSLQWNTAGREVVVFNPHSWPASGPALLEIGLGEHPVDPATRLAAPLRVARSLNTQRWVELWLHDLPGFSYRRIPLRPGAPAVVEPAPVTGEVVLENEHVRLVVDVARGCATSWVDKALERELVDSSDEWGLGQFVYVTCGEGTRLISNQGDLPEAELALEGSFVLDEAARLDDALGTRLTIIGRTAAGTLQMTWSLYPGQRAVDVTYTLEKEWRLHKEAGYVALPLALAQAEVLSDSQLGWVAWERAQLPGGCKEWLPLQSGILLREAGSAVHIASPDVPLFCSGDVVRGLWPREMALRGGRVFSYVFNNYWHTNYRAAQAGSLRFGYRLSAGAVIEPAEAYRRGWLARQPLYGQRISLQEFRSEQSPYDQPVGGTLAEVTPAEAALVMLEAGRDGGMLLRLQEIGGAAREATVRFPGRPVARAWQCDLLGRRQEALAANPDGVLAVALPAWGLATVEVEMG